MLVRTAIVVAIATSLAGCANERAAEPMALGFHGNATESTPSPPPRRRALSIPRPASGVRQTLGGKVLSAIAFERVTGLKADPSRLRDLH
ncbi:MAG: hypothetical protein JNM89_01710 [Hyphomicrobiaceae bacterium]|nr:hypothetical protein [Hyphomicrobiaceae bacterium]